MDALVHEAREVGEAGSDGMTDSGYLLFHEEELHVIVW